MLLRYLFVRSLLCYMSSVCVVLCITAIQPSGRCTLSASFIPKSLASVTPWWVYILVLKEEGSSSIESGHHL